MLNRPAQRMRPWQQEVAAQVAGITVPLLALSAACLGTQLTLSSENLPFGNVVLGSKVMHSPSSPLRQPCPVLSAMHGPSSFSLVCMTPLYARIAACHPVCLTAWTLWQRTITLPIANHENACAVVGYTEGSGREQRRCRHQVCAGCDCSWAAFCCLPCLRLPGPQPAHPS